MTRATTITPAVLEIICPLPTRALSSNGAHGHWSQASKARKEYREVVGWSVLAAKGRPDILWSAPEKARVSVVFCIKGTRGTIFYAPRDEANAASAFKGGFDALVDAKVILDDSKTHMELGTVTIDSKRGPFVVVTVEALQ